jgi:hypothetical protein
LVVICVVHCSVFVGILHTVACKVGCRVWYAGFGFGNPEDET